MRDDNGYLRFLRNLFLAPRPVDIFAVFRAGIKPRLQLAGGFSRGVALVAALGFLAPMAGCASSPSWVKPWKWLDSDNQPKPDPKLEYPNLAEVPPKPTGTTPEQMRAQLAAGLVADRANARHSDEVLRNASMSDGSPPIISPVPAAAPAPVAPAAAPVAPAPTVASPVPALPTAPVAALPAGAASNPSSIEFAPASTKIDAAQRAKLSTIAALQKEGKGKVRLIGRAAEDEPVKSKDATAHIIGLFDLSLRRAQVVAAELQKMGVPADAILVEGKGADAMAARAVTVTLE